MNNDLKLSVAMAVYNSEDVIARTLHSVYDWVDEIVIVEGTSSDQTVQIIRELDQAGKIQVFTEKNEANFIANKQKALERCTGDWILELDDDEVVTPELRDEIKEKLNFHFREVPALSGGKINLDLISHPQLDNATIDTFAGTSRKYAYWIPRLNHFLGRPLRKGGQYPDYTIRLYKRKHARFPVKSIHDQVEIDGKATTKGNFVLNDTLGKLEHPILHYPYKNIGVFFRKWSQYASYEGDELYKKGVRPTAGLFISHIIVKPLHWFLLTYLRHKGFQDGLAGFFFSLLSGLRFWVEYLRIVETEHKKSSSS